MPNLVYLVCSYSSRFPELEHKVIKAFDSYDKAEDYVIEQEKLESNNYLDFIIETIAVL